MRRTASTIGVYVLAVLIAVLIVEIGYRIRLLSNDVRLQLSASVPANLPYIGAYTHSLWRYDEKEGFYYVSRKNIFFAQVTNGRIVSCDPLIDIQDGSPGVSEGNYQDAKLKIAVFGDSFSVRTDEHNLTWITRLQRVLQHKVGQSVKVMNYARDGEGLLQMLDVASSIIPKSKPDIAIIAFNTYSALSPRIWRVETVIDGDSRIITTREPTKTPDVSNKSMAYDTAILHAGITKEWCNNHTMGGPLDKVGTEVIDEYLRYRQTRYSAFTLSRSFFWNRIVNRDPFFVKAQSDPPPPSTVSPDSVTKDARLNAAIERLKETGTPYVFVHLPLASEIKAGKEYSVATAEDIVRLVSRRTGKAVYELLHYVPPIENTDRISSSPADPHPSSFGMEIYAEAVARAIVENHFVPQARVH